MAENSAGELMDWGSSDSCDGKPKIHSAPAYESDRFFYRVVAMSLGLAILASVAGSVLLAFYGKQTQESLLAIGSAAVGALAGVLAARR